MKGWPRKPIRFCLNRAGPGELRRTINATGSSTGNSKRPTIAALKPRFEYLFKVVGELLDLPPHDQRVTLSAFSIHGLIIMFRPNPMSERFGAQLKLKFTPERITEHLASTGELVAG